MIPGIPFETDEELTQESFFQYFRALQIGLGVLDGAGVKPTSLRIHHGVLSIEVEGRTPLIYLVRPCCEDCKEELEKAAAVGDVSPYAPERTVPAEFPVIPPEVWKNAPRTNCPGCNESKKSP